MPTIILRLAKVECFKLIDLSKILFVGFVKFEINIKPWFLAYKDHFRTWFSLGGLRMLEYFF